MTDTKTHDSMQLMTLDETRRGSRPLTEANLETWVKALPNTRTATEGEPPTKGYGFAVRCDDNAESRAVATDILVRVMMATVDAFRAGSGGDTVPLIWQAWCKPVMDTWRGVEYRDDGPDICPDTGRPCVKNTGLAYVKIYARFGADRPPAP